MLLVSMGSQPIQCERIINTIIDSNISEKIVIQSFYENTQHKIIPPNISIVDFIPYEKMTELLENADIVVTSGTGNIMRSLKLNKKVIIFTRLAKYNEAADDHGADMKILADMGYAEYVEDEKTFKELYEKCKSKKYKPFESNNKMFIAKLVEEMGKMR